MTSKVECHQTQGYFALTVTPNQEYPMVRRCVSPVAHSELAEDHSSSITNVLSYKIFERKGMSATFVYNW